MSPFLGEHRKLNVLVVDDEQLVADTLVQILNLNGFNAISRYSGSQAIDRAHTNPFDVLIIEVVMDRMTGINSALEVLGILPECKVLLVSGDNRSTDVVKDAHEGGHHFEILPKPVHPTVIIDWLKAIAVQSSVN